jgi:flagellar biosynthesis protein
VALEEQIGAPPSVVASGRGFVAEKILDLAFANDVKVREDTDLVQILAAMYVVSPTLSLPPLS